MGTCRLCSLWRLRVARLCALADGAWRCGVGVLRLPAAVSDAYPTNSLKKTVEKFNESMDSTILQMDGLRTSTQTQQSPKRLHCKPIFDASEAVLDLMKVALPPEVMTAAEFEANHEPLSLQDFFSRAVVASCPFESKGDREIVLSFAWQRDHAAHEEARGLFAQHVRQGRGAESRGDVGLWAWQFLRVAFRQGMGKDWLERVAGTARTNAAKAWPWIVDSDVQSVILVTDEAKKVMTVADVACFAAQTMGITSLNLVEHTMAQKSEASLCGFSRSMGRLRLANPRTSAMRSVPNPRCQS